jgi:hypothetical protein
VKVNSPRRIGASVVILLIGVLATLGLPAHAADEVTNHSSELVINADGSLEVTSTMTFEAGAPARVEQEIALTEEIVDEREYVFTVSDLTVTADGAAAGTTDIGRDAAVVVVEQPGAREIALHYRVTGAAVQMPGERTQVRWDVLQGLNLPVANVEAQVVLPGQFSDFRCIAGAPGTQESCDLAEGVPHQSPNPRINDGPRAAGEVVGVRLMFPATVVASNEEIHERWTVARAFTGTGWPLIVALAALLLGALVLYLLHRRAGRDARPSGDPIEVAHFRSTGAGESEFQVGGEVLPGEVGTVVDERVDPIDVTATIVDLAVRGHLLIVELPRRTEFAPTDWELRRRESTGGQLRPYERALLDAVAPADGSPVLVSEIGPAVAETIPTVQSHLYDDVVDQGFFERRPDSIRNVWNQAALILLVLGVVLTGVLAAFTRFGLTGLALIAVGLGLALVAQEMPARTEKGARLLAGLGQLRSQLQSHSTEEMPKGREYHELSEVLPYAIVLGGADRWLDALVRADTDEDPDSTDLAWYHGPDNWHMRDLPDSLRNFLTTINGNLFAR